MVMFPRVPAHVVVRAMLPFVSGLVAIAMVIAAYFFFSSRMMEKMEEAERARMLKIAGSIAALAEKGHPQRGIFMENDGVVTLDEFLMDALGLEKFTLMKVEHPDSLPDEPFFETKISSRNEQLVLVYPLKDFGDGGAVVKLVAVPAMVREGIRNGGYNIFLAGAAVIFIVLFPAMLLKLAEIRREADLSEFRRDDINIEEKKSGPGDPKSGIMMQVLDHEGFLPTFVLDESGALVYMNTVAEKLVDLKLCDVKGMKFHEMPCLPKEMRAGIDYPGPGEISVFDATLIDASGERKIRSFRMEGLSGRGFIVTVPIEGTSLTPVSSTGGGYLNGEVAPPVSQAVLQEVYDRLKKKLRYGRERFGSDAELAGFMSELEEILGIEAAAGGVSNGGETIGKVSIAAELEKMVSTMAGVLPNRVTVELDIPDNLPQVECDRTDLTQMIKNLIFFSLESNEGPVRIRISAREVPYPASDSVFSANCDRNVPRAVCIGYNDGTRIPVVLKEALMNPETDVSGIKRDFGTHMSFVAGVISRLDCHPVFTEDVTGSTLYLLFKSYEEYASDDSGTAVGRMDFNAVSIAVCDGSRNVRETVANTLSMFGCDVIKAPALDEILELMEESRDFLILDTSSFVDLVDDVVEELLKNFPRMVIILTGSSVDMDVPRGGRWGRLKVLAKPYTIDDILKIVEATRSAERDGADSEIGRKNRD